MIDSIGRISYMRLFDESSILRNLYLFVLSSSFRKADFAIIPNQKYPEVYCRRLVFLMV